MTSNHLLISHLAELMLKHEQNILPVDLLFDDEQIGDFVKSIQIDSPYQQMLLEGVLTESIKDEKLYVSFTVEGYFHYVLGEVIYSKTEGLEAIALKQIIEENKLNGAKEGVKQCLIRDVKKDDLSRLMWLIDQGGEFINVCSIPLAHSFLNSIRQFNTEPEQEQAYNVQINRVLNELLSNPTDNDIDALNTAIEYLEELQKNEYIVILYRQINGIIIPDNLKKAILSVKSIEHINEKDRGNKLRNLTNFEVNEENNISILYYHSLAKQYEHIAEYDEAIKYLNKSLELNTTLNGNNHLSYKSINLINNIGEINSYKGDFHNAIKLYEMALSITGTNENHNAYTAIIFNNLGVAWSELGETEKAIKYYNKSLDINKIASGNYHPDTTVIYNNLGTAFCEESNFKQAIPYFEIFLKNSLITKGFNSQDTALAYHNLSWAQEATEDYSNAIKNSIKALEIRLKIFGANHPETAKSYNILGNIYKSLKVFDKALMFYSKSFKLFSKTLGETHHYTMLLKEKIDQLNDI